jgi:hypothetical protein
MSLRYIRRCCRLQPTYEVTNNACISDTLESIQIVNPIRHNQHMSRNPIPHALFAWNAVMTGTGDFPSDISFQHQIVPKGTPFSRRPRLQQRQRRR